MAHSSRPKEPLEVLQSMINGILIETGRALRASDKEGGRTLANSNTRLRSTIPLAAENFHQALDDLESDIVRAKAVLLRDLEELRAERIALENPLPESLEDTIKDEPVADIKQVPSDSVVEDYQSTPQAMVKDEDALPKVSEALNAEDPTKETISKLSTEKGAQGPSPPSSNENQGKTGLGIDTSAGADTSAPGTAEVPDSSIDSLFDMPEDGNVNDDSALNYDGIAFSIQDSNAQDNSQAQNNDFDLSTFGNNSQDFNMTDLDTSNNTNNPTSTKEDDLFGMVENNAGDDVMDLDLNLPHEEESVFNDIYFSIGGDDGNIEGGEIEHNFDNAFFGLDG